MIDPQPMTGPEHAKEALRLAELAELRDHPLASGIGTYEPTDAQRHRMLMRALVHATLARQPRTAHTLPAQVGRRRPQTLLDVIRANPATTAVHLVGVFVVAGFALWVAFQIGGMVG